MNSCKQKPTWSSRAATGPFLGRSLARLPAFFFPFMPKVFRTAISSVLIWVCSPAGLAKPFIILRAWSCEAPSQVVFFFFVNSRWPRLLYLSQPNERGRYSSSEALPSAHPSVGRFAFFFPLYRCEGEREMSFHMAHLSYSNYTAGLNRVMTTWPLAFFFFFFFFAEG